MFVTMSSGVFCTPKSRMIFCTKGNAKARCTPASRSGAKNTVSTCELTVLLISRLVMPTFCMMSKRLWSS